MEDELLQVATDAIEKLDTVLAPQRRSRADARRMLRRYAHLKKLVCFGEAALSARLGDAVELARVTGTSVGRARQTLETGRHLAEAPELGEALRHAEVSWDQAEEIAKTEAIRPGSTGDLLELTRTESFHVMREKARQLRLEAQAGPGLAERQHQARYLRHHVTDLGMVHLDAELEPHVGIPIVNRIEAEARRLARAARASGGFALGLGDPPTLTASTAATGSAPNGTTTKGTPPATPPPSTTSKPAAHPANQAKTAADRKAGEHRPRRSAPP